MSVRHEHLTPAEIERQSALDCSWEGAQRALADPSVRSYLERSIERLNNLSSTERLSKEDFLASTEPPRL